MRRFRLSWLAVWVGVLAAVVSLTTPSGAAQAATVHRSAGALQWGPSQLVDHTPPFSAPGQLSATACPTATTCLTVGPSGLVVSNTGPTTTVSTGVDGGADLQDLSCPSATLCAASADSDLIVSNDPTDAQPHWRRVHFRFSALGPFLQGVSCPTARLCVAWTDSNQIRVSADPSGPASTWRAVRLPVSGATSPDDLVCVAGSTFCTAALGGGRFLTTTHPGRGPAAWRLSRTATANTPEQFVCPSLHLCAGINPGLDDLGATEFSTDPAAGASSWQRGLLPGVGTDPNRSASNIACATDEECVIALDDGSVATSFHAQAGAASYSPSTVIAPEGFARGDQPRMACPTVSSCVIPDGAQNLVLLDPGPPVTGTVVPVDAGSTPLLGLTCPSSTLCVGTDPKGAILVSTQPTDTAAGMGWTRTLQPGVHALNGVACPSISFCIAVGDDNTVLTSSDPVGTPLWQHTTLTQTMEIESGDSPGPVPFDLLSVSCPSQSLCVAGVNFYGLFVTTDPAGGPSAWRYLDIIGGGNASGFDSVSCPTTTLCVAAENTRGRIAVATQPAGSARDWRQVTLVGHGSFDASVNAVSCPTAHFCLAAGSDGAVYTTTHPTGGTRAWRRVRLIRHGLTAASCSSTQLCVVSDASHTYTATDPGGPRSAWHRATLAIDRYHLARRANEQLRALACAPTSFCLAGSGIGAVFPGVSPAPAAAARAARAAARQ